jgi:hypothetical protein
MTREEAIEVCKPVWGGCSNDVVRCLERLGLLKLETIDDATFKSGVDALTGRRVCLINGGVSIISRDGAGEVMDVLRKSGFKITKE